jgi:hypothetical protein
MVHLYVRFAKVTTLAKNGQSPNKGTLDIVPDSIIRPLFISTTIIVQSGKPIGRREQIERQADFSTF